MEFADDNGLNHVGDRLATATFGHVALKNHQLSFQKCFFHELACTSFESESRFDRTFNR